LLSFTASQYWHDSQTNGHLGAYGKFVKSFRSEDPDAIYGQPKNQYIDFRGSLLALCLLKLTTQNEAL
jgi:hypothetical protein